MMNRAFAELSIDANYTAMSVRREDLERAFAELKEKRIAGLNVTMPFKTAITSLLDGLDDRSARVGAVNVVKKSDSEYLGFNTDVDGVIKPLRKAIPREKVDRAVLIGTGGAARAFLEGLHQFKCSQILLLVRSLNRGKAFLEEQKKKYPNMSIELHQIAEVGFSSSMTGA
jgi:shikimate dehydrogenase